MVFIILLLSNAYLPRYHYGLVSVELWWIIVCAAFGSNNNNSIIIMRVYLFVNDNVGNELINLSGLVFVIINQIYHQRKQHVSFKICVILISYTYISTISRIYNNYSVQSIMRQYCYIIEYRIFRILYCGMYDKYSKHCLNATNEI